MNKPFVNALAMALALDGAMDLPAALEFATEFEEDNRELLGDAVSFASAPISAGPSRQGIQAALAQAGVDDPEGAPTSIVNRGDENRATTRYAPVLGIDGLTDKQRAATKNCVGLCQNCQQPENDHLPGCARIPGMGSDMRARTKAALPPAI